MGGRLTAIFPSSSKTWSTEYFWPKKASLPSLRRRRMACAGECVLTGSSKSAAGSAMHVTGAS
jgi:hypothetical protein